MPPGLANGQPEEDEDSPDDSGCLLISLHSPCQVVAVAVTEGHDRPFGRHAFPYVCQTDPTPTFVSTNQADRQPNCAAPLGQHHVQQTLARLQVIGPGMVETY